VTAAMVKKWVSAITEEHSLAGVKQLSLALRAAVRGVRGGEEGGEVYHVSGTSEFNAVVLACLTHVTPCLNHHIPPLPSSNTPKKRPFRPSSHKNWGRVRPVAESHCLVVMELVRGLKEPSMVCAVLRHIQSLVAYYASVSRLHRCLSRCLLQLWEGQETRVQVLAFLVLRQLTLLSPHLSPHLSLHTSLKKLYLTFVRNAKFTSLSSLPRIAFMKNCVVEMISLDVATGYQHGFVYIRQLALHLRAATTSGKKDALQVVRSWQFVHSLDLWCQALSSLHPSPSLSTLLYPLIEISLGTLSLQPSPRTVPLRLHLVSSLSRLAAATDTFIPLAPFLLEILESNSSQMKPGSSSGKPPELSCLLRASATQLQSRGYQVTFLSSLLLLPICQTHSTVTCGGSQLGLISPR
jgi:nucleolar complex protein 2